jgi:hypothetical protein
MEINNTMIATIDTPHSLNTGFPALIKFFKDSIAFRVIQNFVPMLSGLKRMTLRVTQKIMEKKLNQKNLTRNLWPVSYKVFTSTVSVEQSKTHQWTREAKKKQIKEHPNINLPAKYRTKYKDLLFKNFKIMKIGKIFAQSQRFFFIKFT